ncbi:hypothetical protein [Parasitella parasitica]|uniref:Reverse transcriptase domain-containing protein n=1 Tax=Parasitella parasitica TaxID=35722 RepID=A0A0B7NLE0_9FUNG|nr:hypothetical protein [Parasitella parasitica]
MQFQASTFLWTQHCGIISFNPLIHLHSLELDLKQQRIIACKVVHANTSFPPFTLVNIYAPATYTQRVTFLKEVMDLPLFNFSPLRPPESLSALQETLDSDPTMLYPMLFMGDFNYHATTYIVDNSDNLTHCTTNLNTGEDIHRRFHQTINTHFLECTRSQEEGSLLPTFRSGTSQSTIDYLYASPFLFQHLHSSDISFMERSGTDHALLRARFVFSSDRQGPGLWRANPRLATNPYFTDSLFPTLDVEFFVKLELTESIDLAAAVEPTTPQANWDELKALVQNIATQVGRNKSNAMERQCKRLQRKRNRICRHHQEPHTRFLQLLRAIKSKIGSIQRDIAENQRLCADHHWREHGETSAGYLKRTIETRAAKKSITGLLHPTTNTLCTNPLAMQSAASTFYGKLYSPDPVVPDSINTLCDSIPPTDTIPTNEHIALQSPFTIADSLSETLRTKLHSSPGVDGLPYVILNVILQHAKAAKLAVKVFNDTLALGIFPASWLKTCMCLLPKSGGLFNLKNWRLLSLICCDAKIFTRLLNSRLMPLMNKLICPQQSGFMPGRFTGENGLIFQTTKLIGAQQSSETIALLLDQEKAYD